MLVMMNSIFRKQNSKNYLINRYKDMIMYNKYNKSIN